jgi:multidrug efflux pump subunit AcrB
MNTSIAYRDMVMMGQLRQVPLSSIATVSFDNTFGGIKRKNSKRMVTISSNVLNGFNPNEVVTSVQQAVEGYSIPEGITINMAGEQEEQKETGTFLGNAMLVSLGLIFLILVTQFNSLSKPLIIISEILFSIIGVLLGFIIFRMDISIVMTGIGVVALAGIVVRNGILLVEFTDILLEEGYELKDAIIEAGKTRMTPVILTATATISGLIPLAIGLNMDFVKLFTEFNPHIYFGGDSVAFWGPLSWTMIFGLAFATVLTLVLVPAMLLISESLKRKFKPKKVEEELADLEIVI